MIDHDPGRVALAPQRLQRWLDRRLTQCGVAGRFGRDVVLAAAVTVASLAVLGVFLPLLSHELRVPLASAQVWWLIAAATGQSLALCLRRVRPLLCLAVVVACQVGIIVAVPGDSVRLLAPLVAAYTIATLTTVRRTTAVIGAAVLVETLAAAVVAMPPSTGTLAGAAGQVASSALSYLVAAFIGVFVATRRRYRQLVRAQAAEAERAQRARLSAAVTAERSQIARELHDVAAHHLSGMVVQAAAVERLVERDPAAARAGAAWLRRQGKETLDNLRQVVGLLRDRAGTPGPTAGADAADHAPVPGLAALGQLVETARALGAEVDLRQQGSATPLPPLADISCYRIAQQSLTNARQHAPGAPVRIELTYGVRRVTLEVENGPAAARPGPAETSPGGTGLAGMRERADLVGAELVAGPTDAGGWRVTLELPVSNVGRDDDRPGAAATTGGGNR
ncbi:hypothetical protein JQS43_16920 [Natronosporangium hydrolyticum]|uniref:histidine kinase n=1 Tax=Natronosporangium hydrolyticum TaxID=2811111 RepID=A0A895YGI8_9ACTN|nr:histidine kinase [Natronosporangium hydrolyticum]QSB13300.1 hypothetical protein JQS43_16920 [Natronosporangium hydrolyticum]